MAREARTVFRPARGRESWRDPPFLSRFCQTLPTAAMEACVETVMSLDEVPDIRSLVSHVA
jgi:hypothetical protein